MAKDNRSLYELEIHGQKRTLLLSPEDAERYGEGAKKVAAKRATTSNKAVTTAANKAADGGQNADVLGDQK